MIVSDYIRDFNEDYAFEVINMTNDIIYLLHAVPVLYIT